MDDTHALIIFSTNLQANEALSKVYPNLKLRPLSQATKESKLKAKKKMGLFFTYYITLLCRNYYFISIERIENKVPKKPRPETTTFLARRLVAGALGIKADINPEQKKAEHEKLRLAKGI